MGITSFYFLCFFTVLLVVYYCIPRKFQWGFLLMGSVAYCLLAGQGALLLYPLVSVGACYAGARLLSGTPAEEDKRRRGILIVTILVNAGILFALKYVNFLVNTLNGAAALFGGPKELVSGVDFLAPLGVSFYTFPCWAM